MIGMVVAAHQAARKYLGDLLRNFGYDTVVFKNSADAMGFVGTSTPELVLVDDSLQPAAVLNLLPVLPPASLKIVTAHEPTPDFCQQARIHGADSVLRKPVSRHGLAMTVQRLHILHSSSPSV
jgi:CheY-like chemotaxis protein